jgi:hypothetical protein
MAYDEIRPAGLSSPEIARHQLSRTGLWPASTGRFFAAKHALPIPKSILQAAGLSLQSPTASTNLTSALAQSQPHEASPEKKVSFADQPPNNGDLNTYYLFTDEALSDTSSTASSPDWRRSSHKDLSTLDPTAIGDAPRPSIVANHSSSLENLSASPKPEKPLKQGSVAVHPLAGLLFGATEEDLQPMLGLAHK